jgi:LysM repeat protein
MTRSLTIIMLLVAFLLAPLANRSQEITRSDVVEHIEGREYFLHTVEQGHTLYSIAKAYDVTVDELVFENPDAGPDLDIGQILRIPVMSRDDIIRDELRKGEYRYIFHIVKKGQTLYGIARIYDVPVSELKEANEDWEAGLRTGQYIRIPVKEPEGLLTDEKGTYEGPGSVHVVSEGETLYSISRRYKIGIPEIRGANPGLTSELSPGQEIIIPDPEKAEKQEEDEKDYIEHTVKQKETLYSIARKYRVSIDSLIIFNPGLTDKIFAGEVIFIPLKENPNNYITHRVREKSKLRRIASKYALSVSSIKDANPGYRRRVQPGDMLIIPVGPPADTDMPPDDDAEMPDEELPVVAEEKSDSLKCYRKMFRDRDELRIALMIPLYAEEVEELQSGLEKGIMDPEKYKSFNFIQFYEGFMMAAEELEDQGLKARVYVYDVDEKVSKTIQVLQQPELTGMDLIIGPFFSRNFKLVSNFAEMFDIKIVNPLTRRTEVLVHDNVFKVKPSRAAQAGMLSKFVEKYHKNSNIILVRNHKFHYAEEIAGIRNALDRIIPYGVEIDNAGLFDIVREYSAADTSLPEGTLLENLMVENRLLHTEQLKREPADSTFFPNGIAEIVYATDSVQGIVSHASIARKNLVVVLSNNKIFAPEILTRLNDLKDTFDITVVGMPEWGLLDNLETDYLLGLNVHFFTEAYTDREDPDVYRFIRDYRGKYQTHPNNYAFEGYDLANFFLGAMMRFGHDCERCLRYYRPETLRGKMHFAPAFPAGYENLFWNFCRYRNYSIEKVPLD